MIHKSIRNREIYEHDSDCPVYQLGVRVGRGMTVTPDEWQDAEKQCRCDGEYAEFLRDDEQRD